MRILIACEFSGVVRRAFRKRGYDAYSCDLERSMDDSPFHLQCDVLNLLNESWDAMIAHPVCTFLTVANSRRWNENIDEQMLAIEFFRKFVECSIPKTVIENPIGVMSTVYRKPDQIIQPWMFGHGETKATCLWYKNCGPLKPTNIVSRREPRTHFESPGMKHGLTRSQRRSLTLPGVADAFATQLFPA